MELMTEQSFSISNIASFTRGVINNLFELEEALLTQSQSEILETLLKMKGLISKLHETATQAVKQFTLNGNLCEQQLELIEKQIGHSFESQKNIKNKIRDVERCISGSKDKKEQIENQLKSLEQEAEKIQRQIDEAQQIDAKKVLLSFVPYYGYYHIGKTIYKLIVSLTSLKEEIQLLSEKIQESNGEINQLNHDFDSLKDTLSGYQENINELKEVQTKLEEQRRACKKGVVFSSNAQLYYSTLNQKLEKVKYRIEDIQDIVEYLNTEVTLIIDDMRDNEILALKDTLIKFGEYADKILSV